MISYRLQPYWVSYLPHIYEYSSIYIVCKIRKTLIEFKNSELSLRGKQNFHIRVPEKSGIIMEKMLRHSSWKIVYRGKSVEKKNVIEMFRTSSMDNFYRLNQQLIITTLSFIRQAHLL
jgi:hypothetical protein